MSRASRYMLVLLIAACGTGDPNTALNVPTIDTLAGGVVRVTNTGPTLWEGTNGWRLVEELVISPADGSPGELSDVTKLVADDDGNVYVMQIAPTVIKVFDRQGTWLRNIGRGGNGPGEFPDGMLGIRGDTLLVQDPNNTRLTTFLTDGTLLGMQRSQCCFFSSAMPVLDDGTLMIMGPAPAGAENPRGAYYLTRTDGTVVDTILRPLPVARASDATTWTVSRKIGGNTATFDIGIPGMPRTESVWRSDGTQVSGSTDRYALTVRRGYGDTLRIIESEAPQLTRSDAERTAMFEREIMGQGEAWRDAIRSVARIDQIPVNKPLWSALATDRAHRIWVGRPGAASDADTLDVFSADGVFLGRLVAPHSRILDGFWTTDRLYLRDTDDADRPVVRVFRLVTEIQ